MSQILPLHFTSKDSQINMSVDPGQKRTPDKIASVGIFQYLKNSLL